MLKDSIRCTFTVCRVSYSGSAGILLSIIQNYGCMHEDQYFVYHVVMRT